jgi:hypothetical protein
MFARALSGTVLGFGFFGIPIPPAPVESHPIRKYPSDGSTARWGGYEGICGGKGGSAFENEGVRSKSNTTAFFIINNTSIATLIPQYPEKVTALP